MARQDAPEDPGTEEIKNENEVRTMADLLSMNVPENWRENIREWF